MIRELEKINLCTGLKNNPGCHGSKVERRGSIKAVWKSLREQRVGSQSVCLQQVATNTSEDTQN